MFCDALYRYAEENREALDNFIGVAEENEDLFKREMMKVSEPLELMSVNYQLAPMDVYSKVCTALGGSHATNAALKVIPYLTLDKFLLDLAVLEPHWALMATTTTLFKRHFNLAEHHLYGSSRLGIKKYLSHQYDYNWGAGTTIDSSNIGIQQAWYYYAINDFVKH